MLEGKEICFSEPVYLLLQLPDLPAPVGQKHNHFKDSEAPVFNRVRYILLGIFPLSHFTFSFKT